MMKAKQKSSLVNVFMLLPSLVRKGFLYVHRLTKVIKTGGIFGRTGREKKKVVSTEMKGPHAVNIETTSTTIFC